LNNKKPFSNFQMQSSREKRMLLNFQMNICLGACPAFSGNTKAHAQRVTGLYAYSPDSFAFRELPAAIPGAKVYRKPFTAMN